MEWILQHDMAHNHCLNYYLMWKLLVFPKKFSSISRNFMPNSRTQKWLRVFFNPFPPSYVTRNNSFKKNHSLLYFISQYRKIYGNFWILSQIKKLQMCILGVVTHLVGPFSANLPTYPVNTSSNHGIILACWI